MKVNGFTSINLTKTKKFEEILLKLNVGEKISGKVVVINNNEVTIKLPNGDSINASIVLPMDISLGDFIELTLKDKLDSQLIFTTQKSDGIQNDILGNNQRQIENILMNLKITPDSRNIDIAKELSNQNLPINKENFFNVINVINKMNTDIPRATFIIANNIHDIENVNQIIDNFVSQKDSIGDMLSKLGVHLSKTNNEIVNKLITQYNTEVISKNVEIQNANISNLIDNFSNGENNIKNLCKSIVSQIINFSTLNNNFSHLENGQITKDLIDNLIQKIGDSIEQQNSPKVSGEFESKNGPNVSAQESSKSIMSFLDENPSVKLQVIEILGNKEALEKFVLEHKQNVNILDKELLNKDLDFKIKDFLNTQNITKIDCTEEVIDVNKLYNVLKLKLDLIEKSVISGGFINSDSIMNTVSQIKGTLSTINNINNMFFYYQIPLNINNKHTNVELFIAKNSNSKKKIDPNNTSFFICLNTINLGRVETLINVNNKKIDFSFNLQSDNLIQYMKKSQSVLENLITNKGYDVNNIKYSISKKNKNIMDINFNNKDAVSKTGLDVKI